MPLSHNDVRRILAILDSAEHLASLDVTIGEFTLHARKPGASAPSSTSIAPSVEVGPVSSAVIEQDDAPVAAEEGVLTAVPEGLVAVRSPMVGTFYLSPTPNQPPFVTVGGTVKAGDTVCLVEVMKMFNTITSNVSGTVERILIQNGKPVQHDQILLLIKPTKEA